MNDPDVVPPLVIVGGLVGDERWTPATTWS